MLKNILLHVNSHFESHFTNNTEGGVVDLMLIKYSTKENVSKQIVNSIRQKIIQIILQEIQSNKSEAEINIRQDLNTNFLQNESRVEAHRLYAIINQYLALTFIRILFDPKESKADTGLISGIQEQLSSIIEIIGIEDVNNIFELTKKDFRNGTLSQFGGGYAQEDYKVLITGMFESGDNQKVVEFINFIDSFELSSLTGAGLSIS